MNHFRLSLSDVQDVSLLFRLPCLPAFMIAFEGIQVSFWNCSPNHPPFYALALLLYNSKRKIINTVLKASNIMKVMSGGEEHQG